MLKNQKQIQKIKKELFELGPILPGSISTQWNVCGKPECCCKRKKDPQKHGPYNQLSFTHNKKSSSMFIKKENLTEVENCLKRYKKFRELNNQLVQVYIQLIREHKQMKD